MFFIYFQLLYCFKLDFLIFLNMDFLVLFICNIKSPSFAIHVEPLSACDVKLLHRVHGLRSSSCTRLERPLLPCAHRPTWHPSFAPGAGCSHAPRAAASCPYCYCRRSSRCSNHKPNQLSFIHPSFSNHFSVYLIKVLFIASIVFFSSFELLLSSILPKQNKFTLIFKQIQTSSDLGQRNFIKERECFFDQ